MRKMMIFIAGMCLNMVAFNSLSAQSYFNEDFTGVGDQLIDDTGTGTTINGVTYHGHTAKTVNDVINAPGTSYQTQVVNEAISVWCEDDSRNPVTWTSEVPDKTVTNVDMDLTQDTILYNFQTQLNRTSGSGYWWYRIQYSTNNGTDWALLKGISSNVTGTQVNVDENLSTPVGGVDKIRINIWRNGGTDPQKILIDNIVFNTVLVSAATEVSETGFTANWTSLTGVDSYTINLYSDEALTTPVGSPITGISGSSQVVSQALTPRIPMYYTVSAVKNSSVVALSDVNSVSHNPYQIVYDFEAGEPVTPGNTDWVVITVPDDIGGAIKDRWYLDTGIVGNKVLSTTLVTDDGPTGTIESPVFTLNNDAEYDGSVTFYQAGGNDLTNLYFAVYRVSDDSEIMKSTGFSNTTGAARSWDLSGVKGEAIYFRLVDTRGGGWGHALIDNLTFDGAVNTSVTDTRRTIERPANLVVSNNSVNSFTLSWDTATGADNYTVTVAKNANLTTDTVSLPSAGITADTTLDITGLDSATTYYYGVKTNTASGSSIRSIGSTNTHYDAGVTDGTAYSLSATWSGAARWQTNSVTTSGAAVNMNNTDSSGTVFYVNQSTTHEATTSPGSTITFTIGTNDKWSGGKVWIDWNKDGVFADAAVETYDTVKNELAGYFKDNRNSNGFWSAVDPYLNADNQTVTIVVPGTGSLPSLPFTTRIRMRTTDVGSGANRVPNSVLPDGYTELGQLQDYAITITDGNIEITGYDPVANTALLKDNPDTDELSEVTALLPATVTISGTADTRGVDSWTDTDSYDGSTPGSYTFTANLSSTLPDGYMDETPEVVTAEVVVDDNIADPIFGATVFLGRHNADDGTYGENAVQLHGGDLSMLVDGVKDGLGLFNTNLVSNQANYNFGFTGTSWSSPITGQVESVKIVMNAFFDGGWFGDDSNDPANAIAPMLQVTTDGISWATVPQTNDYLPIVTAVAANSGVIPEVTFNLNTPATGITGIRLFGENGGTALTNGFIGVRELEVIAAPEDIEITGYESLADVFVKSGDTSLDELAEVQAVLSATVTINDGSLTTRSVTWAGDSVPSYDNATPGTYLFTATLGSLPDGYKDETPETVTVNVIVTEPLEIGDVIAVDLSAVSGSAANYNVLIPSQNVSPNVYRGTIESGSVVKYSDGTTIADGVAILVENSYDATGGNDGKSAWGGTATDPYYVVEAEDILYQAPVNPITLTFSGLDNSLKYNVRIYALYDDGNGGTDTYTVTNGVGTESSVMARADRISKATLEEAGGVFNFLETDGSGNIVTSVQVTAGGGWNAFAAAVLEVVDPVTPAIGLEVSLSDTELVWTVEDEINVMQYEVIYTLNGETFTEVIEAKGLAVYTLTLPEGAADVELVVVDESGFEDSYVPSDGNVSIEAYDLEEGWNLIAITSDNADLQKLKDETVGLIWGWNGRGYEIIEKAQATDAVWVYSPTAKQIYVTGIRSDAKITLTTGWNMVGPVENDYIPAEADTVYSWSKVYDMIAGEDKVLIGGKGYWIFSF